VTAELVLRPAAPTDAARLHELHTDSVRALCAPQYAADVIDGWLLNRRPESYLSDIERGDIFVVEAAGRVVGFGAAVPGQVIAVYVDPDAAHRGVGAAVMRRALEMAARGHAGPIRLESTLNAKTFYERFGFRELRRATVPRNHVAIAVVVMERSSP
jgi:GNAT superfamily N-acetyltransferase